MDPTSLSVQFVLGPTGLNGGVKSTRLLAEALARRGHDVRIAYTDPPLRPWQVRRRWARLRQRWRPGIAHHLENAAVELVPVARPEVRAADVPPADVVVATWWETMEWIRGWPAGHGLRAYFVQHHEVYFPETERVRATYRVPALLCVVSRWLERVMVEEYGARDVVRVPDGVDRTLFDAPPRVRAARPTVGFYYDEPELKGASTALAALRRLRRHHPRLRTVAFGPVPLARRHRGGPPVEYHLRPPQERIAEIHRSADVWLVPSRSEGFGLPGLEAAACRCPVVATRCGGPEDYVVDGENGYLVPVDDPEAMAAALRRVLEAGDDAWRRMSERSYEISRGFDWDRSAARFEAAVLAFAERSGREGRP